MRRKAIHGDALLTVRELRGFQPGDEVQLAEGGRWTRVVAVYSDLNVLHLAGGSRYKRFPCSFNQVFSWRPAK